MAQRTDIEVAGLKEFIDAMEFLSSSDKRKYVQAGMREAGKKIVVPAVKASLAADIVHPKSHKGKEGKQGRKGPLADKVTVRQQRKRGQELAALNVAPRAWYRHFFIQGTKPHVISASSASGKVDRASIRKVNKGKILRLPRGWTSVVMHPGSGGHNSVQRAAAAHGDEVGRLVAEGIFKEMNRRSKRRG